MDLDVEQSEVYLVETASSVSVDRENQTVVVTTTAGDVWTYVQTWRGWQRDSRQPEPSVQHSLTRLLLGEVPPIFGKEPKIRPWSEART